MKKLIGIGIAAMMVLGLGVAANAVPDTDWLIAMKATDGNGTNSLYTGSTNAFFGTNAAGKSFGYAVAGDDLAVAWGTSTTKIAVYTYLQKSATDSTLQQERQDRRAPLVNPSDKQVWNITVGSLAGSYNQVKLKMWFKDATATSTIDTSDVLVSLYSVGEFGGARTLLWSNDTNSAKYAQLGTAEPSTFVWDSGVMGAASIPNYKFELEASVAPVPEPGSIVAMLSGLVGLAGFGIRRRK